MKKTKSKLVVLTGAGISAESGLGTFRDKGGLWDEYDINDVATPEAWFKNPELVLDFYNKRREIVIEAQPNAAHVSLATLENHFDVHIVTQNIDDLHERAGSSQILHLHGEILKAECSENSNEVISIKGPFLKWGDLSKAGHQLRPHVVWFGEPVPKMMEAEKIVSQADVFLIVGTSLNVYPAANLLYACKKLCRKYIIDLNDMSNVKFNNLILMKGKASVRVPELVDTLINEFV